jgi:hypothetical protein
MEPIPDNSRVRYCSQCQSAVHLIDVCADAGLTSVPILE